MTNEEKMAVLVLVYNTIFQSKAQNTDITQILMTTNMGNFPGRWFKEGLLRGFDFSLNTGTKVISIRCVEQNPNKVDNFGNLKKYANMARQGHKIIWVIDQNTENGFLGRMQDGEWIPSFVPATNPVPNKEPYTANEEAGYAHINKDVNDPNFNGIPGTSGTPLENLPIEMAMQQNLPQPGMQNAAEAQDHYMNYVQDVAMPLDTADLPEINNGGDIPEYVLESIAEMDEPPDWGDYE